MLASCGQACQRGEGWGYFHFCWTRVTLSVPAPFVLTSALVPLGRVRHPPTKMEANTSLASAPAPVMVLDRPCSCRWTPWAWAQSPIVHPSSRGQGEAELGSVRPQRLALQGHDFWLGWGLKFFCVCLNFLTFLKQCVLFVLKINTDESQGLGEVGADGCFQGIGGQGESACSCTCQGKRWGPGAGMGALRRPSRQDRSPPHSALLQMGDASAERLAAGLR